MKCHVSLFLWMKQNKILKALPALIMIDMCNECVKKAFNTYFY